MNKNGNIRRLRSWAGRIIVFSGYFLLSNVCVAGVNSGADFLNIAVGAEAAALGRACTTLVGGANALNWNPAGIVNTPSQIGAPSSELTFSHQNIFADSNLDQLGIVVPLRSEKNKTAIGLNVVRLSYASQERRELDRSRTGSFGASDLAVGASAAHNFRGVSMGFQMKAIQQKLAGHDATGFAMDAGAFSPTALQGLNVGASVRNLGPSMKFVNEEFALPLTITFGASYQVIQHLALALDVENKPRQKQTALSIGSQFAASQSVVLRCGYMAKLAESVSNSQKSESNRGFEGLNGVAGGLGIKFSQFSLDYAVTPFGELGYTQALTVNTWFGGNGANHRSHRSSASSTRNEALQTTPLERWGLQLEFPSTAETWWGNLKP